LKVLIETSYLVKTHLEAYRSAFAWEKLLVRVLENNDEIKYIIKNYKNIIKENVMQYSNIYFIDGILSDPNPTY